MISGYCKRKWLSSLRCRFVWRWCFLGMLPATPSLQDDQADRNQSHSAIAIPQETLPGDNKPPTCPTTVTTTVSATGTCKIPSFAFSDRESHPTCYHRRLPSRSRLPRTTCRLCLCLNHHRDHQHELSGYHHEYHYGSGLSAYDV